MRLTTVFLMMAMALVASGSALADDDDGPPTVSWTAVELNGKPVEGLTLDYTTDKASGTGGCNRFNGPINIEDDAIQIGPLASTKMMCEGKSEIESQYFAALEAARSFTIDGGMLVIKDDGGKVILKFKK
jgi:heat shock protein HslJ